MYTWGWIMKTTKQKKRQKKIIELENQINLIISKELPY